MKKLSYVLLFILILPVILFATDPQDNVLFTRDYIPWGYNPTAIQNYVKYASITSYNKTLVSLIVSTGLEVNADITLENDEIISNGTDAYLFFKFNDDAATLGNVVFQSTNDDGNIADSDLINYVMLRALDEDSTAVNDWCVIQAKITDATGSSKDSQYLFKTYDANSQVTPLTLTGNDAVFADDVEINGTVTMENDETIDNATNGTVQVTSGVLKHSYDAAAYWTATQADGGMVTFNSVSDGTAGFNFADNLLSSAHGATLVTDSEVSEANYIGVVHQTVFTFTADTVNIMDHAAAGAHGKKLLMTFPAGIIKFIGATSDISVTCGTDGLTATATYDYALGSTAAGIDNSTLATTEQDIMTLVEGDLSSSAADWNGYDVTDLGLDGHTTPITCYLNIAFEQDDASANDVATITGTIKVTWVNLGDY